MFIAAAAATLACYPESVASQVCHPVEGLPREQKFLPSIAEIREACEKAAGTWFPPPGTLSPQGFVYGQGGRINFLAEPRNRRFFYED